jgi:protoporphyrin/coproporphyrin ferrochelatase
MKKAVQKAVLLINLGTPSAPTPVAVRHYLTEFLSDPRVVELPACLWKPVLKLLILPIRGRRSTKLYQAVWAEEGSPLAVYSKKLAKKVQNQLGLRYRVGLAMRYGQPSIQTILEQLLEDNVQSLILLPLYPQYAAATTASCFDVLAKFFMQRRFIPSLHFISGYYSHSLYIAALANAIRHFWQKNGTEAYLLFSFHGLPKRAVTLGDPYAQQCQITVDLLAHSLNLSPERYRLVFQSRFGKAQWLQPYCDAVLQQLPKQGIKQVAVICPGFAVDCLETLEEIAQRYQELFLKAGGERFHYIPALNASDIHSELICDLVQQACLNTD